MYYFWNNGNSGSLCFRVWSLRRCCLGTARLRLEPQMPELETSKRMFGPSQLPFQRCGGQGWAGKWLLVHRAEHTTTSLVFFPLPQWFSKLTHMRIIWKGLWILTAEPYLKFPRVGLGKGPRTCISDKLLIDFEAAGLGPHFGEPLG